MAGNKKAYAIDLFGFDEASREALRARLKARGQLADREVNARVEEILETIQTRGLEAVLDYGERFDHVRLKAEELRVSEAEIKEALDATDAGLLQSMRRAAARIRRFHEAQMANLGAVSMDDGQGRRLGLRVRALDRVGLYVPGGSAPLPSSVLMNAIPASVAGCPEIAICSPPGRDGRIAPVILAAAHLAGVREIYRIGGAQAIAAMAYGLGEWLPRVDKICGPGNIYVNTAKRMLYGLVDIDLFAGPSEILIVADQSAAPPFVARDLIAQAEHDPRASAILLTTDEGLAKQVQAMLPELCAASPRADILRRSIGEKSALVLLPSLESAYELANHIAPEHLELCLEEAEIPAALQAVRHAGAIFVGHYSPEALGDYDAGPNHVLPTSGSARFSSPLNCADFVKKTSIIQYSRAALLEDAADILRLAEAEGLPGHADSIRCRQDTADLNPCVRKEDRPC